MSPYDQTQAQTDEDRNRSKELSLKSAKPPAKIPGYSIEQFLGNGAYGEVWSGTEKKTGRRVAIKFYTRRSNNDIELLAGEVEKLLALAADRYVVQLVDVDWQANPPYFVMDYFEGGSLEDLLVKEKALSVPQAEDLFCEIATGLMHLHGKGIFHCDLKPGNILLDDDGKPRLADFGQSRLKTEKSPSLGTLFFMAPEQADLKTVPAAKWDVFALGAILYCMLVGKPPYQSDKLREQLESATGVEDRLAVYQRALKSAPLPTEHRKVPGVDKALADIIDRAIAPNPSQRFNSVQGIMFAMRQRELSKARKPLLILGILGPLLLLSVMSLFAWITYDRAYGNTLRAVDKEAIDSNQFAARLAANSVSTKIEEYFRAVEELARDETFVKDLLVALKDKQLTQYANQLNDPNDNSNETLSEIREKFRANQSRKVLQKYMDTRIQNSYGQYPDCASWFVNDRAGNQLASKFENTPGTITIGRNYSYRTYFSGHPRDAKEKNQDGLTRFKVGKIPQERKIIDRPHLSAVFLSKGTSTWKVAFSVPIRDKQEKTIGIVACTAEMGKFIELDFGNASQYATLIDGRPGDYTGAILEHPVFKHTDIHPESIPKVTNLSEIETTRRYADPIAVFPEGKSYDREWIAVMEPVICESFAGPVVNDEEDANANSDIREAICNSGLLVLVAEDADVVYKPVSNLGSQLFWLAIYASCFFVIIALAMWLLVFRMFKESGNRLARSFSSAGDSTFPSRTTTNTV